MRPLLSFLVSAAVACTGGGGGGGGGDAPGFPGVWLYQEGSFSFVNCYTTSTTVDLTRSGCQIVDEAGKLVRINPDGCRFTLNPTTARHASGVPGEECTVPGDSMTTTFRLNSLVLELKPDDQSQMICPLGQGRFAMPPQLFGAGAHSPL